MPSPSVMATPWPPAMKKIFVTPRRSIRGRANELTRSAALRVLCISAFRFVSGPLLPAREFAEPRLGWCLEIIILPAPREAQPSGVQGMVRQNEPLSLLIGQPAFNQGQIQVFIATINLVAHDGMPQMRQVQTDLVLAAGPGGNLQEREWKLGKGWMDWWMDGLKLRHAG